ncbi:MAG: hypothetical protein MZV63_58270 [Marinilabiliales bacterium]|nr:hypothetical protein [Marinilabiliales bacterium]
MQSILLSALVFMMCTEEKSRLHEVELKQAEEMKSGTRVENVFLDIAYGMSQSATFSRFRQLAYQGVIDLGKGSVFEYAMKLDTQTVMVWISHGLFPRQFVQLFLDSEREK